MLPFWGVGTGATAGVPLCADCIDAVPPDSFRQWFRMEPGQFLSDLGLWLRDHGVVNYNDYRGFHRRGLALGDELRGKGRSAIQA